MSITIITASAGTGKTTRLSQVLDDAIASGTVRPEAIIATTFTRHAAAELVERARSRLLASGHGREAHQLLAARIGTVNSVCGSFVTDFAFELGLSPALRVLDEGAAELELQRALATVVSPLLSDELFGFKQRFDGQLDWRLEVRRIVDAARSNAIDADGLRRCAARSMAGVDRCLGPVAVDGEAIDAALLAAIEAALGAIDLDRDKTKSTRAYVELLRDARVALADAQLRWGDWAKLSKCAPAKTSEAHAGAVQAAASRHVEHPRLRREMHRLTELLFAVAADGLVAYQAHKRGRGLIDFVDQEALALGLLRRPDVREALAGQIDLVLVDEFQDTSPLQLAIFLELASLATEAVWVGDQKQAIYGFRGTDPALMDAMIESLTATTTDPDLVSAAVAALGHTGQTETLTTSYRSRPALVEITSELFARAFREHGIPDERTRLTAALAVDPAPLGPVLEYWPIVLEVRENKAVLAAAVAAGVQTLLADRPAVRDRRTGAVRVGTASDVAVLCRTNDQCQLVATALATLGIGAVVPRLHLLETAEGELVLAGLALWVDGGDALAGARIARLVEYAADLDAFVARVLEAPGRAAFAANPIVAAIAAARATAPDLDPAAVVGAIIDATGARELCAAWGSGEQRCANLDALHAHAVAYLERARSGREAASVVGLLGAFSEMVETSGWSTTRSDSQALLAGAEAVTVSTWHAAKGREWPITVLFGLESLREPRADGLHVESDVVAFDLAAPLAGRWLRYWPNPYTTSNQGGPVKAAYAASAELAAAEARTAREVLRLLYVGWTRARDRLVLAACAGKLLGGLVGALSRGVPDLVVEPDPDREGDVIVQWAGRGVPIRVRSPGAGIPAVSASSGGEIAVGGGVRAHPSARRSPSTAAAIACTVGVPVTLGPRLGLRGAAAMNLVGDAVHAFFAADERTASSAVRTQRAQALLEGHAVHAHLDAAEVAAAASRLWTWLESSLGVTRFHREWPLSQRAAEGTLVVGTADLVGRSAAGFVLVDHKTFPGTLAQALERVPRYSGQLATYAAMITAATGEPVASTWIHLPMLGLAVPIAL